MSAETKVILFLKRLIMSERLLILVNGECFVYGTSSASFRNCNNYENGKVWKSNNFATFLST